MEIEREEASGDVNAPRSLDRLLLDEANHRMSNEVCAALAALRLAKSAKGHRARLHMIELAIDRLDGFGECSRVFAGVSVAQTDAGSLVEQVCRAMLRSRVGRGPRRVLLDIRIIMVDGETARRVAMIAFELILNALKHAFPKGGGELKVRLERVADGLILSIADDGPGLQFGTSSMTGGNRLGGRIVGELVRASRGRLECESGPQGTAINVMLPAMQAS